MNKIIGWVAVISILWIIVAQVYEKPTVTEAQTFAKIGAEAPGFTLQTLHGKSYSLAKAKGKPLVINFWNAWCHPCRKETPELIKLYKQYKGEFQLYGVNVTADDSLGAVKLFVEHFHIPYPVLLDKSGSVSNHYNVTGRPVTYFINAQGIVVGKIVGYQPNALRKKIKALISQ